MRTTNSHKFSTKSYEMIEMVKSNCIRLQKGDKVPHDGILYTLERHEAIEHLMTPEGVQELIKENDTNFEKQKGVGQHG